MNWWQLPVHSNKNIREDLFTIINVLYAFVLRLFVWFSVILLSSACIWYIITPTKTKHSVQHHLSCLIYYCSNNSSLLYIMSCLCGTVVRLLYSGLISRVVIFAIFLFRHNRGFLNLRIWFPQQSYIHFTIFE
jgi:hypothetical protein